MRTLLALGACLALLAPLGALAADFDLTAGYAQSRDFWETVHDVQNQMGNLGQIERVLHDRYGRPDIAYSYLDAAYSYEHDWFESSALSHAWIGTHAEALAGGEVSNPVFPEIQAYANTIGIASYGLHSRPDSLARGSSYWSFRFLGGIGSEKRLYATGPEFIDAIPVRSGTLYTGGAEVGFVDQSSFGEDFWITTYALVRPMYFHSTVEAAPSLPNEPRSFATWRWRVQNEWLKETSSFLSHRTRVGVISVLGQNPVPFTSLPISWDYQQKTQLFPGFGSVSGGGAIARFLTESGVPNVAVYGGVFGGALGGGVDLQLGAVLLNASTYALENSLTTAHDRTRLWQGTLGLSL